MFTVTDGCSTAPGYPWSAITRGIGGRVTAAGRRGRRPGRRRSGWRSATRRCSSSSGERRTRSRGVHLFHAAPVGALSCASCHPEGARTGRCGVWDLRRRTSPPDAVAGGWSLSANRASALDGALVDLPALLTDTYGVRMGGRLYAGDNHAFAAFLAQTPAAPRRPAGKDPSGTRLW